MSRERMTHVIEAEELAKRIAVLEKLVGAEDDELEKHADEAEEDDEKMAKKAAADDKGLESEADAIAKKDMAEVNKSRPAGPADLKDQGDQNAKANDNWPVADKTKVASMLVRLAKEILK